jgi:DNA-binding transcriptional LysR family regulator
VSHAMQALEERLGLRLVARTTRSVSVTEAGQRLLTRLGPALEHIDAALLDVGQLRERPAGRIRLIAPPIVLSTLLSPKLAAFTRTYPDIVLDITSEDDTRGDLVARRYDAGVHLGEFLQRDMTAVRVTREQRAAVVAAPSYFAAYPKPKKPSDITAHRCVRYRMGPDGPIYRWEFEKRGKPVSVSASGPVIVGDAQFIIRAALDGVGLAYILEDYVADHIARGELVRVLEDWCPPFDGYFLYYPSRRQQSPALRALVATLRV